MKTTIIIIIIIIIIIFFFFRNATRPQLRVKASMCVQKSKLKNVIEKYFKTNNWMLHGI
jgi:uncharacterized membrane protein YvbJ